MRILVQDQRRVRYPDGADDAFALSVDGLHAGAASRKPYWGPTMPAEPAGRN